MRVAQLEKELASLSWIRDPNMQLASNSKKRQPEEDDGSSLELLFELPGNSENPSTQRNKGASAIVVDISASASV